MIVLTNLLCAPYSIWGVSRAVSVHERGESGWYGTPPGKQQGRSSKAEWALVLWGSARKDVMSLRWLLILAILMVSCNEGKTTPPRDTGLSFVLGGSWFQRSERGLSGNYLTVDFKVSAPYI